MIAIPKDKSIDLLKKLSFPRPTGSNNEILAQKIIINELKKLKYQVKLEKVKYIKSKIIRKIETVARYQIILWLTIISTFLHPLIIVFLFSLYFYSKFYFYPKIQLKLAKGITYNLIANYVSNKNYRNNKKIVLCAHYDTAKIRNESMQKRFKLYSNIFDFTDFLTYSFIVLLFFTGITNISFTKSFSWQDGLLSFNSLIIESMWLFFIFYFCIINLLFIYFILSNKNRYSSGANDNASGVYVLLKIAEAVKKMKFNINIDFNFFAAEEIGYYGCRNWIKSHISKLEKSKTYFINVDTVGKGNALFINKGIGHVVKHYSNNFLIDTLKECATEIGFKTENFWGVFGDDSKLLEENLQACGIITSYPRKNSIISTLLNKLFLMPADIAIPFFDYIHNINDEYSNINKKNINKTIKLLLQSIEIIQKQLDSR